MPSDREITEKFWKALKSDMTLMLGLADEHGGGRPMTAQLDKDAQTGPVWFFVSADTELVKALSEPQEAAGHFASKGHDLFAAVQGRIAIDNDRAVIDRLWNPFIAAWFEGGKDDPNLRLLRWDPDHAHIWLNENNIFAGVKLLLGSDPKKDYQDKVADVPLN